MGRLITPGGVGISTDEAIDRQLVADRLYELLGPKPVAELARRLGDKSRTRAYKILNCGQSVTLTLVKELARVFDKSPIDFLAPLEDAADVRLVRAQAISRYLGDMQRVQEAALGQFTAQLGRPGAEAFLRAAMNAAGYLSDQELTYERKRFEVWAENGARRRAPWLDTESLLHAIAQSAGDEVEVVRYGRIGVDGKPVPDEP